MLGIKYLTVVCLLVGWAGLGSLEAAQPLVISEFLAANSGGMADEDGDREDWIELRNTTGQAVNAAGWGLTDDPEVPLKWRLPAVTVPAGGYLVVFASGKDRAVVGARLHTNFRLNNAGEYLALWEPDGEVVSTEFSPQYPPQATDVSFGTAPSGDLRFFDPPTPGAANGEGFLDRVADTKFSVDRGFHSDAFDLVISCATSGAEIRYTTNGTPPTATSGMVANGPIRIAGTTAIRAAAFRAGWLPSNVDTHTYLFTSDIIRQSPNGEAPPDWPASWGANTVDYGMDPDVVNDPRYQGTLEDDLRTLPSFCVTVHLPDLFDRSRGIYANPGQDGRAWERPMSLELVYPDGRQGFQVDGGIRIRGGFSRSTSNPKHAFRFFFRQEYGAGRLVYPLFGDRGTDEFDGFDLRTFQNYSWSFQGDSRGTFMRDQFNRDLQLAMGSQGERGDYYHLYINGQYWGLYNTCERPEASYAESYYGGDKDDYDVIKVETGPYTILATDGTMAGWTTVYNLARAGVDDTKFRRLLGQNPDGTRNPSYPVYVDPVNLIDYMLIILYGGNLDAPISNFLGNTSPNNFFGIWNHTTGAQGWQWFVHDAEHTMLDVNADRTGPYAAGNSSVDKSNPQWLWQKLLESEEFRILVRDRIQRHFFNSGVLTPETARQIYLQRRDQIDRAVVAESARWGDSKRSSPLTRDDHWVPSVNGSLTFLQRRADVVVGQLQSDVQFGAVPVPRFNQQGGSVNPGFGLLMSPTASTIYYTLDGTDPRRPGGAVASGARPYTAPITLSESVTVKARVLSEGNWSALNEADFVLIQTFTNLFLTEIHYHPAGTPDRDGDAFEFLELKNTGRQSLDLSGVHFTDGLSFQFPNGTRLAAGQFAVLVRNAEAFAERYPGIPVAGVYQGRLSNSGERLALAHAVGTPLFDLVYGTEAPWPSLADGDGFSLVPHQPQTEAGPVGASGWRASSSVGGSPGADDPAAGVLPVVVNELLTHTDPPLLDAVELYNPNDEPAPIGGWWLSDDRGEPMKYRIPSGRVIAPHGFVTFSELDFNRPTNAPSSFTFSSYGEDVWLFSGDEGGNLTGYSDGFSFGAAANAVTFGRHTNSVGKVGFPAQVANTLDLPNSGPRLGPVVLNEIHYAPAAGGAEFVEVRNLTESDVPLYDVEASTNTWRINGIGFEFPTGVVLPPGGLALVTAGDPVAVRAEYGIPESVPVLGPFPGTLQDGGETLTLERPDHPDLLPDGSVFVPYYAVDAVQYDNRLPWPLEAAGQGASLERITPVGYADDPASWRASPGEPSPGFPNGGNRSPVVDAGPDREIEGSVFPLEVALAGVASDDGLPVAPGRLTLTWTQVDGPGQIEFVDPAVSNAVVRLPGTGVFTLRLTAFDGERSRSDDVVLSSRRPAEAQTWIAAGSSWNYLDDGSDQGEAWRMPDFNDASWATGAAQLGFGDGDEQTAIRSTIGGTKTTTFYFRREFESPPPSAVSGLQVRLVRDDGAMVYVNGTLVFRSNMPEGEVNASTWASEVVGGGDESAFFERDVDTGVLVAGRNVIAVEVHQQNSGSSDVSFDLELQAQVSAMNTAPLADAGPDREAGAGEPIVLQGTYQDDGLPNPPGVVRFAWERIEGSGEVHFSATNVPSPTVTFTAAGRQVLRFTVDDGELAVSDEMAVMVGGDPYDAWRAQWFTAEELADPAISGDDADPDEDGQRNRDEYLSGTLPRDGASVLRVLAMRLASGEVQLEVSVVEGRSYSVLRRTDLPGSGWEVLQHLDAAPCTCAVAITDPGVSGGRMEFYQVVTPRMP